MPKCQCGATLDGRRRKCDECKKRPGRIDSPPKKPVARAAKKAPARAAKPVAKRAPAKKVAAKKTPAKKVAAKKAATPTPPADPNAPPAGLKSRGRELWLALALGLDSPAGQIALEACRLADRLDELDSIIAGKGVLELMAFRLHLDLDDATNLQVTVGFQSVLAEARQQQVAFKSLLAEISSKVAPGARPAPTPAAAAKPGNPLDELKRRRERKAK